jgi:hypothetical protein
MAFGHCVLAIGRHGHKLAMLDLHHVVQHIQEAGSQVENVFGSVPLEHWDGDQVQIGHDVADVDTNAHVDERVAMMCVAILGNQKCLDQ